MIALVKVVNLAQTSFWEGEFQSIYRRLSRPAPNRLIIQLWDEQVPCDAEHNAWRDKGLSFARGTVADQHWRPDLQFLSLAVGSMQASSNIVSLLLYQQLIKGKPLLMISRQLCVVPWVHAAAPRCPGWLHQLRDSWRPCGEVYDVCVPPWEHRL